MCMCSHAIVGSKKRNFPHLLQFLITLIWVPFDTKTTRWQLYWVVTNLFIFVGESSANPYVVLCVRMRLNPLLHIYFFPLGSAFVLGRTREVFNDFNYSSTQLNSHKILPPGLPYKNTQLDWRARRWHIARLCAAFRERKCNAHYFKVSPKTQYVWR